MICFCFRNESHANQAGADPIPVSFRRAQFNAVTVLCLVSCGRRRWDVAPLTSQGTCIFVPNAAEPGSEVLTKKVAFGLHFTGNYHKIPSNSVVSLMWEANTSLFFVLRCHRRNWLVEVGPFF